jgi:hypothetical protein
VPTAATTTTTTTTATTTTTTTTTYILYIKCVSYCPKVLKRDIRHISEQVFYLHG